MRRSAVKYYLLFMIWLFYSAHSSWGYWHKIKIKPAKFPAWKGEKLTRAHP